jgi:hypothetical protein
MVADGFRGKPGGPLWEEACCFLKISMLSWFESHAEEAVLYRNGGDLQEMIQCPERFVMMPV